MSNVPSKSMENVSKIIKLLNAITPFFLAVSEAAFLGLRDGSRKNQFLPGRFAQKIFFERDVSSRDDSRIFPKIDFKVLFIKIYQLNAMCI